MAKSTTRELHRPTAVALTVSLGAALLAAAPLAARADTALLARLAFETGGDDLEGLRFEDGSTATIAAGGTTRLELGVRTDLLGPAFDTELGVGYKFDQISASNAELTFSRITVDALQYLRIGERFRVGGGITYHLNPTLDVDAPDGAGGRVDLKAEADDALGYALAADYLLGESLELGLRGTIIEYEFESGAARSGDNVGLYATYRF